MLFSAETARDEHRLRLSYGLLDFDVELKTTDLIWTEICQVVSDTTLSDHDVSLLLYIRQSGIT